MRRKLATTGRRHENTRRHEATMGRRSQTMRRWHDYTRR